MKRANSYYAAIAQAVHDKIGRDGQKIIFEVLSKSAQQTDTIVRAIEQVYTNKADYELKINGQIQDKDANTGSSFKI